VVPGAVGAFAYGKYVSPDYRGPDRFFPVIGTRTGTPEVQNQKDIYFNVTLPSSKMPDEGWPVAFLGHGSGNNKNAFQLVLAAKLAERGVATVAINQLGHGFGPLGTLVVNRTKGEPVTLPAGGRSEDVNGDGTIGGQEGAGGDAARQFATDHLQLVRVLQVGVDVDGDGARDLDPARIFYAGNSLGGINGIQFAAVEPDLRAAVLSVTAGGGLTENRLSVVNRDLVGNPLASRTPPLLNAPGITVLGGVAMPEPYFNENLALRKGLPLDVTLEDGTKEVIQSPQVNTVKGALAIQELLEHNQWIQASRFFQPAYAVHLRRAPLPGVPAKPVIFQFGKGDYSQPNPGTTAILRAGDLADMTLYFRNDLAYAEDPTLPKNPHGFMVNPATVNPRLAEISRGAQDQIAAFFASDGKEVIHPEPKRFFEVPIKGPLPEEPNYIP
jgi:pimeloyl-ACP methyl ester carboxylesterase